MAAEPYDRDYFMQPRRGLEGGYGTSNDTNVPIQREAIPHVIELSGGDDGTRTRDLCRDRAAF